MMRTYPFVASVVLTCYLWLEDVKAFLSEMLRDSRPGNGARRQRPTHLEFFPLEARDCPAVITWLGGTVGNPNSWSVGSNWSSGTVPASTDDVVFDGTYSTLDCDFGGLGSSPLANSLTLKSSYTGTLHLQSPAAVEVGAGGIELDGGDIEQDQGEAINDDGNFTWTGGSLNVNSSAVADLNLSSGKTANISGAQDDATGDNIKTASGSTVVLNKSDGTNAFKITFSKNAGINIASGGTMNWTDGNLANATGSTGVITNAGNLYKTPGVAIAASTDLAIVNSGTFQLQGGKQITINGKDSNNYAFDQPLTGTCELSQTSVLAVAGGNGFHMGGGNLWADGSGALISQGNVLVDGGVISINHDHANATGVLFISKDLTLQGTAEYDTKVDSTSLSADQISAGNITIGGNAKLKAISINLTGMPPRVALGKTWVILKSGTGKTITGDFAAGNKILDFNDGSGKKYTTAEDGPPATTYFLKSPSPP